MSKKPPLQNLRFKWWEHVTIREYLSAKGDKDLGEDELRQLLSEFFCDKNPDVERFLKILKKSKIKQISETILTDWRKQGKVTIKKWVFT